MVLLEFAMNRPDWINTMATSATGTTTFMHVPVRAQPLS
jgi:hypothetical protein